jgi:hypothetical protein
MEINNILYLCNKFAQLTSELDEELILPINDNQKDQAVDEKVTWIVDINPLIFLKLTAANPGQYPSMDHLLNKNLIKDVSFYKDPEIAKGLSVHPFLSVDKITGKVVGHEGRHRAAAVHHAGGNKFRIGIKLYPTSRGYKPQDMPSVLVGQYIPISYDIKDLISQGKLRIVDDNLQRIYQK